jgi:ribosomal protein S8
MEDEVFIRIYRILFHWRTFEEKSRQELIHYEDDDFVKRFIEPFRRELGENIISKVSSHEKYELIIFYINELNRPLYITQYWNYLYDVGLFESLPISCTDISNGLNIEIDETFIIMIHLLFMRIFDEIQSLCIVFKIDFLKICKELEFPTEIIDKRITIEHVEKKRLIASKNTVEDKSQNPYRSKPTETLRFGKVLKKHGFNKLIMVRDLSEESVDNLIGFLVSHDLPYKLAMLDFVGFIKYVEKEYGSTKVDLYKNLADILLSTTRAIKGNINVLNPVSKEDKRRFTSHQYIETVKADYQKIK